ncbi:uncharacterized protein LOC101239081 isoform X1 [Hydra vulgaris]|uniref:uncharacterized protein LOC101239081 isoform X1 n=1 Tax=Hydra vulgaris TaxID=6087 RepID=UPI0032E9F2E8
MQEDIFFSHITVRQCLEFVGKIRLPENMKGSEKKAVVDQVINELGLDKCQNTILGSDIFEGGCSGGEKKRCSIGVELISNPACIIMDEPTTGLDSATAFNLIHTLKVLGKKENRSICMTIHQPSSQVFFMFDKLMLMCDGRVAFYGKNSDVLPFFDSIGIPCYLNWNPADFLLERLSDFDVQNKIVESYEIYKTNKSCNKEKKKLHDSKTFNKGISNTSYAADDISDDTICDEVGDVKEIYSNVVSKDEIKIKTEKWPTGYRSQALALCQRSFIQTKGDVWDMVNIIQVVTLSVAVGLFWFRTPFDEKSLGDRQGVIFFILSYMFIRQMMQAILSFPAEKKVIEKERASGMYRLSAYYTAKNIVDVPVFLLPQLIIYITTYWLVGLNCHPIFLLGLLNVFLTTALSQSVGLVIGAGIKNVKKGLAVAVVFNMISMILGGFYNKRYSIYLNWCRYVSVYSYLYNIFLHMEFQHARELFKCSPHSQFQECLKNRTYIEGRQIMPYIKPVNLNIVQSVLIVVSVIVLLRTLFYFVLKTSNK